MCGFVSLRLPHRYCEFFPVKEMSQYIFKHKLEKQTHSCIMLSGFCDSLLQFVFTVPSSDILINFNILIRLQESTFPKISYCFFKFKLRTREHLMSTDLNRKMSSVSTLGKLTVLSSSSPSHVSSRPVWSSNTRLDLKSDAEVTFDLMEEEEEAATGVQWANV